MDAVVIYLREVRKQRGISQESVADAAGLSLRQYSRWETGAGETSLKDEAFIRVVDYLGASFDEIRRRFFEIADSVPTDDLDAIRRMVQGATPEERARMLRVLDALIGS